MAKKAKILYFSHGGGPLPILGDSGHKRLVSFLREVSTRFTKPEAIIVISAHWEESVPTVNAASNPPLFFDYYGFPKETYALTYSAPGNPVLAEKIAALIKGFNMSVGLETKRGNDHGVFIPMMFMYPEADIPIVQLSLIKGLDAKKHILLGKALQPLLEENILIIGSGFSFHNLNAFFNQSQGAKDSANNDFQNWLIETCTTSMDQTLRENRLIQWETAPSARYCHPREEHLLPLHVCAGMSGNAGKVVFDDEILGKRSLGIMW